MRSQCDGYQLEHLLAVRSVLSSHRLKLSLENVSAFPISAAAVVRRGRH